MSAAAHLPSRPESYLTPTPLAERLWRAGWVHITPAEVFAERAQQREPAFVPAHDGTCLVLLIANQQAPLQCAPPIAPLPASCRAPGAMCFALSDGERTRYVAAPQNGFFHRAAEPSWPAGGPLAAGVQRVMKEADPNARVWRVDNPRRWQERMPGADIVAVVSTPDVSVIHIARMTADAHRELRADKYVRMVPLMPSSSSGEAPLGNVAAIVRRER